jgi:hypothetical protein
VHWVRRVQYRRDDGAIGHPGLDGRHDLVGAGRVEMGGGFVEQ